ncbi:MAG: hypothetical protein BIFFINMI_00838 [Phycisphaerae bacterium]|nr:hypothetical protein [Phycisphaerae bacterium]
MQLMNRLQRLYWTARGLGWDNLPRRLVHELRKRSGRLRRRLDPRRFDDAAYRRDTGLTPGQSRSLWSQRAGRMLPLPTPTMLERVAGGREWQAAVTDVCEQALAGDYPFFSNWTGRLGWPPDFNLDPVHDIHWPTNEHWTRTARSGPPRDDIKLVWEPSRFTLAFHLARTYVRDGSERWAEAFWRMFDAWVEQNPPMLTVAWGCGQEMTFRLMAMLFAASATLESPAATDDRLDALSRLAWQTANSVEATIDYARSQENNHALSEAAGLWTVGLLFPEFPRARKWRDAGQQVLAAESARQIYADGSFVQNSLNYHRVMMDDLAWCCALGRRNGQLLDGVEHRLAAATDWLGEMIDPASGRVPNYGANDGANVLPLSVCDYLDYRPTLQAAHGLLHGCRRLAAGPWDEKMLWLCGRESLSAPVKSPPRSAAWSAPDGGYYVLRGPRSWAMTRCHTFRDRPGQPDMLHVDLWIDGVNVLRDGGSYSYQAPPPWKQYFKSTAAQNTVEVGGVDQMVHGPGFLWFQWTRSRLAKFAASPDDGAGDFEGEHDGYRRLRPGVLHRRAVARRGEFWIVVDDLLGAGRTELALRWRLAEGNWRQMERNAWSADLPGVGPIRVAVAAEAEGRLLAGQESPGPEGWESLYYGRKQPAPTVVLAESADLPRRYVTVIAPGPRLGVAVRSETLIVSGETVLEMTFAPPGRSPILA